MDTQNIVSVIGSGTMGNGIAHVFSMCPKVKQVFLVDLSDSILNKAKLIISKNLDRQIKKNIINENDAKIAYNKISSVFDNYSIRLETFAQEFVNRLTK